MDRNEEVPCHFNLFICCGNTAKATCDFYWHTYYKMISAWDSWHCFHNKPFLKRDKDHTTHKSVISHRWETLGIRWISCWYPTWWFSHSHLSQYQYRYQCMEIIKINSFYYTYIICKYIQINLQKLCILNVDGKGHGICSKYKMISRILKLLLLPLNDLCWSVTELSST